ncbi:hypothetical protein NOR53_690 [gamma proteobacterium NOR5-3]|nr:hypothetical protein NOR53_690 [gamma proteobacterium NOR5-3]
MTPLASKQTASRDYILAHITEDLYRQTPISSVIIIFIVVFFWLALKSQTNSVMLNVWAMTLAGTALTRLLIWFVRHQNPERFSNKTWLNIFSLSCVGVGASWSLIFLSVNDWNNLALLAAPWMLILGVLSAASVALGQHIPTFFSTPLPRCS